MKNRIIAIFLVIFFSVIILNLNEVFGVGIVSQCWGYDVNEDGKNDMVYRVFLNPSNTLVKEYYKNTSTDWVEGGGWTFTYNNNTYTSKWISLLDSTQSTVGSGNYLTVKYAFHTEMMGDYSTAGNIGYSDSSVPITEYFPSLRDSVNAATSKMVTPAVSKSYDDVVFYEVNRINGKYTKVDWGTGLVLNGTTFNKNTQYRQAIINVDGNNVLVYDHVIYHDDLVGLIAAAKERGKLDGCYVSQILVSQSRYNDNYYEVSRTLKDFFSQYDKSSWWSQATHGRTSKSLGAVANLYDNELIFPQMSKRTVLVRHINVGNNTVISTDVIKNASRIPSNNLTLKAGEDTITGLNYSNNYSGYEEYYEELIDVDKTVTKEALSDPSKYNLLGHNVSIALSYDSAVKGLEQRIASGQCNSGNIAVAPARSDMGESDVVIIDFYYTEYEKDVTVNHYYTDKNGIVKALDKQTIVPNTTANNGALPRINNDTYIKEIYVKKLGQNIKVTTASSLANTDAKYQGYELFTEEDIANGRVVGIGEQGSYKYTSTTATLTSDNVQVNFYYTIENTELLVEPEKDSDGSVFIKNTQNTSATCSDTTDSGTVYKNVTSIPSGSSVIVGIKDIPKYMLGAITTEYVSPASATHKMNLTIKLTMGKQQDKTIELKNIPYKVGYYKITDMAVYKLNSAKVYDAEAAGATTVGESLFDWDSKTLNLTDMGHSVVMTGVKNRTIYNSTINNINNYVTAQISGASKATGIQISSGENSMNSTVYVPYISDKEFEKVDANSDFKITEEDKVYAQNKLQEYANILEVAKTTEKEKQRQYEGAVKEQARLKDEYDNAAKTLEELKAIYDAAERERINKQNNITAIKNDITTLSNATLPKLQTQLSQLKSELTTLEQDLDKLEQQLEKLKNEKTLLEQQLTALNAQKVRLEADLEELKHEKTKLEADLESLEFEKESLEHELELLERQYTLLTNNVIQAEAALNNVEETSKNSPQYIAYQESVETRRQLRQNALCKDTIDEDEFINKDIIEACKQAKLDYQENLNNKVVENALAKYEQYLKKQKEFAIETLSKAREAQSNKRTEIAYKNTEISNKQTEINNKNAEITAKNTEISSKNSQIAAKNTEISNKKGQITAKNTEISNKQTEINNKNSEITAKKQAIKDKNSEIASTNSDITNKNVVLKMAQNDYSAYLRETWTPAHDNYFNYLNNVYTPAENNYNTYVNEQYVQKAYDAWQTAIANVNTAQSNYNAYQQYKNTLDSLYDSYKAMYDEFIGLTNETAASILGLKLNITVQNMSVKFRVGSGSYEQLTESSKNSSTGSYNVTDLQSITSDDDKRIPQVTTDRITISQDYYNNISNTKISESYYNNKGTDYIAKDILNGVRVLAGKVEYKPQVVIGNKTATQIIDNVYYNQPGVNDDEDTTKIFKLATETMTQKYEINNQTTDYNEKYEKVKPLNIYTPITVSSTLSSDTNDIVDQTQNVDLNTTMIQLNTSFTINLQNNEREINYNISNTNKYVAGYYIKFDFDVHNVYINNKKYNNGDRVSAGVWIGMISKSNAGTAIVKAQAYGNISGSGMDIVSEDNGSYTVRAVAYNATDLMLNESIKYDSLASMTQQTSGLKNTVENICINPSYFAQQKYNVLIVNRLFDFRITDVKDINWKSVFRKTSGSNTNSHSGILYYSGMTKWNTNSDESNDIIPRTTSEIGRSPLRTLPIGPYKNTDSTYIKAPKLGYRFSFDMKVTGSYYDSKGEPRTNKKVNITTKFYYISKDGSNYLKESDGKSEGIYLFYKTSAGKYVRIDENGGGYNLTFTPNDGYRYIESGDTSNLSKSVVSLGNLRNLTLTYNMATVSSNGAVITYYGDYKLPNSTIAVKVNKDGTYDINKPLKDGYIGVVFDIVANSGVNAAKEVELAYSKDTKQQKANTSQWDYEGFLDYTDYGNIVDVENDVTLKLERGTWRITNDNIYNQIKGSVILYDIDERAATDYE